LGQVVGGLQKNELGAASDAFDEAELDSFAERLKGERALASERLYRTFLMREALPVALGRYARRQLEVPTLLLVGERDFGMPQHTARKHAAETQALELELVGDAGATSSWTRSLSWLLTGRCASSRTSRRPLGCGPGRTGMAVAWRRARSGTGRLRSVW
jgi:pimeloyl-ACP methyl ester carboxylesterase